MQLQLPQTFLGATIYLDANIFCATKCFSCFQLPVSLVLGIHMCMLRVLRVLHNLSRPQRMNKKQFSGVSSRARKGKQTEQCGNLENINDCVYMHTLFLFLVALFVLVFILREQTTASSEAGNDGEHRQFFGITLQGNSWVKTWDKWNLRSCTCMYHVDCDCKFSTSPLLPDSFTYVDHGNCRSPCPRHCWCHITPLDFSFDLQCGGWAGNHALP